MKQFITNTILSLFILLFSNCNSSNASEEAVKQNNMLVTKLNSIKLDIVEFDEGANIRDAVQFFRQRARELDTPNTPPALDPNIKPIEMVTPEAETQKISINIYNVTLMEAIAKVAKTAKVDAYVTSHGVRIVSKGTNPIPKNRDDVKVVYIIHKNSN